MKKIKKLLSAGLVLAMAATLLAGCGGSSNAGKSGDNSGTVHAAGKGEKGRYVEEDYGYSFGIADDEYAMMRSIVQLSDGTIRGWLSGDTIRFMDSADGGKTWSETSADMSQISALMQTDENGNKYPYIDQVAMDKEGNVVFVYSENVNTETETSYIYDTTTTWYFLSKDGELKELSVEIPGIPKTRHEEYSKSEDKATVMDETSEAGQDENDDDIIIDDGSNDDDYYNDYNGIQTIILADANKMYVLDYNGQVYCVDINAGQITSTIDDAEYMSSIYVCGDKLIAYDWNNVYEYSTATGEKVGEHEDLAKLWQNARTSVIVAASPDDANTIYYAYDEGIFKYDFTTKESVMVVDGHMSSLVSLDVHINTLLPKADGQFLLAIDDYADEEYSQTMLNYSYDPEMPARPDKELTIYTMTDDYGVRTIAANFQKNHPDIYVNVETGRTGEDAITSSDAIRTLNTEIMAGEGPDIMYMNDLPINSYIEKGLLGDISGLVDPLISEGKLFEKIANTYREADGKLYAVPATFAVPVIVGKQTDLDKINSLSDIAAIVTANPDKAAVAYYDMMSLAGTMSVTNMTAWFNEDNTLNEENLKAYITDVETIVDAAYEALTDEYKTYFNDAKHYYLESDFSYGFRVNDATNSALDIMAGNQSFSLGQISDVYGIQTLSSIARTGKDISYKAMPGVITNVYMPSNIFGMNSKCKNTEAAEEFMKYLLSEKGQKAFGRYNGFAVNTDTFNKNLEDPRLGEEGYDPNQSYGGMSTVDENGNQISLDLYWPNESEVNAFKTFVNTLDTPSYVDTTILGTILNDSNKAILGDESVDNVVAQIVKDLNIYLSE